MYIFSIDLKQLDSEEKSSQQDPFVTREEGVVSIPSEDTEK